MASLAAERRAAVLAAAEEGHSEAEIAAQLQIDVKAVRRILDAAERDPLPDEPPERTPRKPPQRKKGEINSRAAYQ